MPRFRSQNSVRKIELQQSVCPGCHIRLQLFPSRSMLIVPRISFKNVLKVLKNSFILTLPTMKRGATTLLRKRKKISPAAPHHLQQRRRSSSKQNKSNGKSNGDGFLGQKGGVAYRLSRFLDH